MDDEDVEDFEDAGAPKEGERSVVASSAASTASNSTRRHFTMSRLCVYTGCHPFLMPLQVPTGIGTRYGVRSRELLWRYSANEIGTICE